MKQEPLKLSEKQTSTKLKRWEVQFLGTLCCLIGEVKYTMHGSSLKTHDTSALGALYSQLNPHDIRGPTEPHVTRECQLNPVTRESRDTRVPTEPPLLHYNTLSTTKSLFSRTVCMYSNLIQLCRNRDLELSYTGNDYKTIYWLVIRNN